MLESSLELLRLYTAVILEVERASMDYYHPAAKLYLLLFCIQSKPHLSTYSMVPKLP